jgi:CRP-like cAMP-binding protein
MSRRLSRVPFREHRAVRADPRFLQLVGVAQVKLDTRPKELGPRELANILNGACGHAVSGALARLVKTSLITPPS